MSGDVSPYTDLITSEHSDKALFIASLIASAQPFADLQAVLEALPEDYDLDTAVASQLDTVGLWVGRTRYLDVPLTDVYFTLDSTTLGLDQGTWKGPFDPDTGLVALPDDTYRILLRARILANAWDGTIPGAYDAWDVVFAGTGYQVLIQDNGDMSMALALVGTEPDAVTMALFTGGYLSFKPAGVRIAFYAIPSLPDTPLFGFDVADGDIVAGLDAGCFAELVIP